MAYDGFDEWLYGKRKAIAGAIGCLSLGFVLGVFSHKDYTNELLKEYENGRKEGYSEGCRQTRERIASDMHDLSVNPTIFVSDHPQISPVEVPYFFENQYRQNK